MFFVYWKVWADCSIAAGGWALTQSYFINFIIRRRDKMTDLNAFQLFEYEIIRRIIDIHSKGSNFLIWALETVSWTILRLILDLYSLKHKQLNKDRRIEPKINSSSVLLDITSTASSSSVFLIFPFSSACCAVPRRAATGSRHISTQYPKLWDLLLFSRSPWFLSRKSEFIPLSRWVWQNRWLSSLR